MLGFPGIGQKTASWVTRNWLDSNRVAIIDVHVFRAATVAGIFRGNEIIARDYARLEERFLRFAEGIGIEARQLDVLMWRQMKDAGRFAIDRFTDRVTSKGNLY